MSLINYLEQAKMILLNRNNRVLGMVDLSTDGSASIVMDIRVVFVIALKSTATSIILAHSYLSGNLRPSSDDIKITKKLKEAAKLLYVELHDHLKITENSYFNVAEEAYI